MTLEADLRLAIAISLGLLCCGCSGSKGASNQPEQPWSLWIDDSLARGQSKRVKVEDSAQAFENAFKLDASCDGLKLVRWTSADKEKYDLLLTSKRYWDIHFGGENGRYFIDIKPGDDIGHTMLALYPVTAEDAVHNACFIAKHRASK